MKMAIHVLLIMSLLVVAPAIAKPGGQGQLPPGVEKRLQQGKPLPPGWARKLGEGQVLDERIVERGEITVPVDESGVVTLEVEGETFRLIEATREIVEILRH